MKLRISEPEKEPYDFNSVAKTITLGREPSCDIAFDGELSRKVSRVHARLVRTETGLRLDPLSKSNSTLVNGQEVSSSVLLKPGDRVRLGFTGPEVCLIAATAGQEYESPPATLFAEVTGPGRSHSPNFVIGQGGIIGRDPGAQYVLDHPHVSRKHAKLQVATDGRVAIVDLASANGTFVNGERVVQSRILRIGDSIDVGPFALRFDGQSLFSGTRANNIQVTATGVGYRIKDTNRKQLTLLDNVSLVIVPGEFVCLLGPSGSGKSTLLNVLSGRRGCSAGSVLINERDLHRNFSALKQDLAVVPQSCVLHDSLTVQQSLRYTAELRLPPDTDEVELRSQLLSNLQTIGLQERRNVKIRQLSGGQLKRAGLGTELMSEPSLLFLDEVTSGLDEQSDGEMMQLFRRLADGGKTLVCITHNLANVEQNCHLIAVLTAGGRLAFYGSPHEAKGYFSIDRLSDVYSELETRRPDEWARKYRESEFHQRYIVSRLPNSTANVDETESEFSRQPVSFWRQFGVLLKRTIAVWQGDLASFAVLGFQALLIALLLCLVFGSVPSEDEPLARKNEIRNLLFLLGVSVFWLGCNNCVKEIVNERLIYQRERAFNLIPEAYLASKAVFFMAIGIVQSVLLCSIVLLWFSMPGERLMMAVMLAVLSICGTCLGLGISAIAKSEAMAVALVPLVIIPQIVLAGVVASLTGLAETLAQVLIPVYWGRLALEKFLPTNDQFDSSVADLNLTTAITMIVLHAFVMLIMADTALRRSRA